MSGQSTEGIIQVATARSAGRVNELLQEGWRLLAIEGTSEFVVPNVPEGPHHPGFVRRGVIYIIGRSEPVQAIGEHPPSPSPSPIEGEGTGASS